VAGAVGPVKLARVASVWGAPRRAVGCFSGFAGVAGVAAAWAWALLVGAEPRLEPDPELLEHEATNAP
jgi:hypothetical protein